MIYQIVNVLVYASFIVLVLGTFLDRGPHDYRDKHTLSQVLLTVACAIFIAWNFLVGIWITGLDFGKQVISLF